MNEKKPQQEREADTVTLVRVAILTLWIVAGKVACDVYIGYQQQKRAKAITATLSTPEAGSSKGFPQLARILRNHGRKIDTESLRLTKEEGQMAQDIIDPTDMESGFADIGGLDDLKQEIWELAVLPNLKPEVFAGTSSNLIQRPSGILLYGKPGCGKTLLAKAIAKESKAVFIPVELSNMLNSHWGVSEKLVAATFSLARKLAPSVVFIDEMDCLLGDFGNSHSALYLDCIKKCFLTALDGISTKENGAPVMVFGATNRPQLLDKAILRRFPRAFAVPLPDSKGREQILRVLLRGQAMDDGAKAFLPKLAKELTEGYSGSDLKELCVAAAMEPVREVFAEESKRAVQTGLVEGGPGSGSGRDDSASKEGCEKAPVAVQGGLVDNDKSELPLGNGKDDPASQKGSKEASSAVQIGNKRTALLEHLMLLEHSGPAKASQETQSEDKGDNSNETIKEANKNAPSAANRDSVDVGRWLQWFWVGGDESESDSNSGKDCSDPQKGCDSDNGKRQSASQEDRKELPGAASKTAHEDSTSGSGGSSKAPSKKENKKKTPTPRPVSEKDFRVALNKVKQTGKVADDFGKREEAPPAELSNSLYI